jgi:hypothetical protein
MNSDEKINSRASRYFSRSPLTMGALALLLFIGYKITGATHMPTPTPVEIYVGESGKSFAARTTTAVDRQPAGLNFYELHWPFKSMGAVILKQGEKRLPIDNVLSVTGTEDMDLQGEGLSDIKINSAISKEEKISHDEARLKTFAYLQKITQLGWMITIPRSKARIRGKDMSDYLLQTDKYTTLDPRYVPTLNEWMRYADRTTWEFYDHRVFLSVQITREHTLTDPLKLGAYLLSTNLQSEAEHFRDYVDGLDRRRWKQLLHAEVENAARSRKKKEAELMLKGVAIDEAYVDPPLPDLSKY